MLYVKLMNEKAYEQASMHYTGAAGLDELETYWSWVYTSFDKYVISGDATHLNRVVDGSRNVQRFRPTMRVIGRLAAHEFHEAGKMFVGKAIEGKFDKLKAMIGVIEVDEHGAETDADVMFWTVRFNELLNTEEEAANKTPEFDPKKWEAAFIRMAVKGIENGESAKLEALISTAKDKAAKAA